MKAVITVLGKDTVGILAKVSTICAAHNINVTEVSQSILGDLFAMLMLVDLEKSTIPVGELADEMKVLGEKIGLVIHVMHEDIFNSMHRI